MHGLLGILPKLIGLCHDSLLIGGAFFGAFHAAKPVPVGTGSLSQTVHLLSLGEMAPAQSAGICLRIVELDAESSPPRHYAELRCSTHAFRSRALAFDVDHVVTRCRDGIETPCKLHLEDHECAPSEADLAEHQIKLPHAEEAHRAP